MTTDITELARDWKAAAHKAKQANDLYLEGKITLSECVVETKDYLDYSDNPNNFLALVHDNSKSWDELYQQVEAKDKRNAELVEALEKAQTINAAAEKLVRCKGRYHSEQNYRALAALFGVTTPDLPPLDGESRTVTVKLPDDAEHDIMAPVAAYLSEKFKWDGSAARWDGRKEYDVLADRVKYALRMVIRRAAGIKWETE